MQILIADSGSTKTDWALLADGQVAGRLQTQGINPFHQAEEDIRAVLTGELLPAYRLLKQEETPSEIYFYGSGVRVEYETVMRRLLGEVFGGAEHVEAHGDLLGAAIAVCGREAGLACILGTGANSCLYDGEHIVQNTPPLGYILGDEGSGAVLGIRFLNALLKGRLSASLREAFFAEQQMTEGDVIARVYRQPMANRWLASLAPFIHDHLGDPGVRDIVVDNFCDFFSRNVVPYGRRDLPVGAVGSIAFFFQSELHEAAGRQGFRLGTVLRSPIDGLVDFFSRQRNS